MLSGCICISVWLTAGQWDCIRTTGNIRSQIVCRSYNTRGIRMATGLAGDRKIAHGPLTRYAKLRVAHAPGMPGTFSPDAEFKGKRGLAIPACITARASRTCRDACRDCLPAVAGKTFPAFPAHAHPQFYVFGKRPMVSHSGGLCHTQLLFVA